MFFDFVTGLYVRNLVIRRLLTFCGFILIEEERLVMCLFV